MLIHKHQHLPTMLTHKHAPPYHADTRTPASLYHADYPSYHATYEHWCMHAPGRPDGGDHICGCADDTVHQHLEGKGDIDDFDVHTCRWFMIVQSHDLSVRGGMMPLFFIRIYSTEELLYLPQNPILRQSLLATQQKKQTHWLGSHKNDNGTWFRRIFVRQIGFGCRSSFMHLHFLFLRQFLRLTHAAHRRMAKTK